MKRLIYLSVMILFCHTGVASANNIASSTMWFEGNLTEVGSGIYSGVIPMVQESAVPCGDGVDGFDIYARHDSTAWFGDLGQNPTWQSLTISNHDAWPAWPVDTPDWYQYSLEFYQEGGQYKWRLRNHPNSTAGSPQSTLARGVPMSGTIDWSETIASETDTGAYLPSTGTAEIPGGAADHGGGAGAWDMDWSWGSEVVPLEFAQFKVAVTNLGGTYRVSLTPLGIRNADSYKIKFEWSDTPPDNGNPGGYVRQDGTDVSMVAVRTSRGFNVYAENGEPDAETGEDVTDHSCWPSWYQDHSWDTPDADPTFNSEAPYYLINLDTYGNKWSLVYSAYLNPPTPGTITMYLPMSGSTKDQQFNGDGTIDIKLEEDGCDWKAYWSWGKENCILEGDEFLLHLDLNTKTGYLMPEKLED